MTLSSMSPIKSPQHPPCNPLLDPSSWHTSNWDINTKFSGYLSWGKRTSFMTSGMTLSSMSLVRNPHCPPSTPFLDPPFMTHFQLRYQHQMFRVTSFGQKKHHSWHKDWPCHPFLRAGTLNVLQVPPILTPHFLPHFQLRYQHKIFRLCSLLPKSYLYPYHFKTNLDQPRTNVNPNQTFAPSKYPQP